MSKEGIKNNFNLYTRWISDNVIIQVKCNGEWEDCSGNLPNWNHEMDYREKPKEHRKFIIILGSSGQIVSSYLHSQSPIPALPAGHTLITATEDIS